MSIVPSAPADDFTVVDWEAEAARACEGKGRYCNVTAREVAAEARRRGRGAVSPYRCPWADDGHWHVGHVPSMESVARIAAAIRARANDLEAAA